MGQFTQNGVIYEELPDGNVRVVGHAPEAPSQGGGMALGGGNPLKPGELTLQQQAIAKAARDAANASSDKIKADADARKAVADAAKAEREASGTVPMSATERANAIAGYKSAEQLGNLIRTMEARYKTGPGATSGLAGLQDYLPTEANARFNSAGNAARGAVGQALAFTGGQLNTAGEAQASVGPYLPQAGNWDSQIGDKIALLKQLEVNARERSIAQLGGIPDQNGRVTPASPNPEHPDQAATPGAVVPPSAVNKSTAIANDGGQPPLALAQGATRTEDDPELSAALATLIRKGKTPDQINAYLAGVGAKPVDAGTVTQAQAYLKTHPDWNPANVTRTVPTTVGERFAASPLGAGVIGATDAGLAGFGDELKGGLQTGFGTMGDYTKARDAADAEKTVTAAAHPFASILGATAGGIGATLSGAGLASKLGLAGAMASKLGKLAPLASDVAYGAAYGAGSNNNGRLGGAFVGGLAGAGAGAGGRSVARLGGALFSGVTAPASRRLAAEGIPLTGGQIMRDRGGLGGKIIGGIEDAATSTPALGDLITARRNEGLLAMNAAGFRKAGEPIGANITAVGSDGVDALRAAEGNAYDRSLSAMNLTLDNSIAPDLNRSAALGRQLPPVQQPQYEATMRKVAGLIDPATGAIPGRNMQAIKQTLRGEMAANKGTASGQFIVDALQPADDAFMGLAQRQAPDAFADYLAADRTHGMLKAVEKATNSASGKAGNPGIWGGAQLATALKGPKVTQATRDALGQLAEDGVRVLPSQLGDSGTVKRAIVNGVSLPPLGAGAYALGASGALGLGSAGIMSMLNTKLGQKLTQAALIGERSPGVTAFGKVLKDRSNTAGVLGRALALPVLLQGQ